MGLISDSLIFGENSYFSYIEQSGPKKGFLKSLENFVITFCQKQSKIKDFMILFSYANRLFKKILVHKLSAKML